MPYLYSFTLISIAAARRNSFRKTLLAGRLGMRLQKTF